MSAFKSFVTIAVKFTPTVVKVYIIPIIMLLMLAVFVWAMLKWTTAANEKLSIEEFDQDIIPDLERDPSDFQDVDNEFWH